MAHSSSTSHYSLPQFAATDKPAWLVDVNPAYSAIDAGMYAAQQAADAAQADATQALDDAAAASGAATTASNTAAGAIASIAEAFDATATYSVGDYVVYNNLFYVCTTAVTTPGPWTGSTNWTRATLDSIATELNADITALESKTGSDIPVSDSSQDTIADAFDNLSNMFLVNTYTATKSVAANFVTALTGADMGYNSIPSGYTPVAYTFSCVNSNDVFMNLNSLTAIGIQQFGVIKNVSSSAQNDKTITVKILFIKTSLL